VNFGILFDPATVERNPGAVYGGRIGPLREARKPSTNKSLIALFGKYDRVTMTRNPYVRFVSSWKDWQHRNKSKHVSFESFSRLYSKGELGYNPSPGHIDPVSKYCNFAGLKGYTHILRLEQQALWFDWFIEHYGLTKSLREYHASGNVLFTPRVGASSRLANLILYIVGRARWPSSLWNSSHHRDSAALAPTLYTPEIARTVTKLFKNDFEHFGYPLWDGNPATFRYV